jgi:hypothetical protein
MKHKLLLLIFLLFITSCGGFYEKTDARKIPTSGPERAKKNLEEGRGISIKNATNAIRGSGTFEFSTSNPMWRASLEVLDFLPMSVVDYSGGMLITDWYSDEVNSNSSLKITIRFLNNEINTNSLKITVHEKNCITASNCNIKILDSRLKEELIASILKQAAILEKETKKK